MGIKTTAKFQNGYYGVFELKDGKFKFKPLGKRPFLEEVLECIEDDSMFLKLSTSVHGRRKVAYIKHGDLLDPQMCRELADLGFDVTRRLTEYFVEVIRLQEENLEAHGTVPTSAYSALGWIQLPYEDSNTLQTAFKLCYRSFKLIGSSRTAKYIGPYDIEPTGDYDAWRQLMEMEIIPYPALQLVLVAALSAVIVGLLSMKIPIENPIVHLNLPSGKGKSTAGYVAASTAGKPFDGTMTAVDEDGKVVEKLSLYQSWGATDNAMVATQAGNRGVVTVLNELGKSLTKNMTRLIFDLSEGSDKKRLNTDLKARISKGYSTAFISTGESSLLEKCDTKLEGLAVRVMEISSPLTKDAEHANRIKDGCFANCGFAAPKLAQYIIRNGGVDFVLPLYKQRVAELRARFSKGPSMERFVEKFAALFVTTAEIASQALKLPFDIAGLLSFLEEYDRDHGAERNTSAASYDLIIQICRSQKHKFYVRHDKSLPRVRISDEVASSPKQECWGRITNMAKEHSDGRLIVQEFEIRKKNLEDLLKSSGYSNKSTCVAAWRSLGVLDAEDATHPCRSRKIDPTAAKGSSEDVYILRAFADDATAAEIRAEKKAEEEKAAKIRKTIPMRNAKLGLEEKEGEHLA